MLSKLSILKKSILLVLGLFIVFGASAQKGKKSDLQILSKLPDFFINDNFMAPKLKAVYKRDAARIALRLINNEQKISQQTVKIPDELVQAVYNALVAIRVSESPSIDTIADKFNIRTFPNPSVNSLTIVFDHDAAWAKPLRMRSDTTGDPRLNLILRKFNINIVKLVNVDEERSGIILFARQPVNIAAFAQMLYNDLGLLSMEEMQPFGDGSDIDMKLAEDGWKVTYSAKFGNCTKKCTRKYEWKFKVSKGGQVSFEGGGGDTIPPWFSSSKTKVDMPDTINKGKAPGTKDFTKDKKTEEKLKKEND